MDGEASGRERWVTETTVAMGQGGRARIAALSAELSALRDRMDRDAAARMAGWQGWLQREAFQASARNLADWLALRAADLSPLQSRLADLGLSSLGRLDGHVRASFDAVIAALTVLSGGPLAEFPDPAKIRGGADILAARRDALFGVRDQGPRTRIMVTLPEAAAGDPALIREMALAGTDCFRINCAHDDAAVWGAMIDHIRAAESAVGRHLPVSMDLGGPKFRITALHDHGKDRLMPGDTFAVLAPGARPPKGMPGIEVSHAALFEALDLGGLISIDDGKFWARVRHREADHAVLEVRTAPEKGMKLKLEKGVNLPGAHLAVPALTDEDLAALDFIVGRADAVSFSFVQAVADVEALLAAMTARAEGQALPAIVLKIETPTALANLPDLIVAAGGRVPVGVMIARGDLAVEIGFDRLSEIQEEILWLCEAAQVPVVWATQVLETMVRTGQATRAEVTDAAMSQRAEAVMLNKGPAIVPTVEFLRDILRRMDRHQAKKHARLPPLHLWRLHADRGTDCGT